MSSNNAKMPASTKSTTAAVVNASETNAATTAAAIKRASSISNGTPKLSSLTPARDLTLGGKGGAGATNKKVFLPNLNAVRNKNT